jgi:hypothetical protein
MPPPGTNAARLCPPSRSPQPSAARSWRSGGRRPSSVDRRCRPQMQTAAPQHRRRRTIADEDADADSRRRSAQSIFHPGLMSNEEEDTCAHPSSDASCCHAALELLGHWMRVLSAVVDSEAAPLSTQRRLASPRCDGYFRQPIAEIVFFSLMACTCPLQPSGEIIVIASCQATGGATFGPRRASRRCQMLDAVGARLDIAVHVLRFALCLGPRGQGVACRCCSPPCNLAAGCGLYGVLCNACKSTTQLFD